MLELIQENPLISFLIILVPVVGGTWKVLHVLFIKPRDFRIAVLEKNVEEIRKELQRTAKSDTALANHTAPAAPSPSAAEVTRKEITDIDTDRTTLLNNMSAFYKAWSNRSFTELQRDHFEKNYLGQKVIWRARLGSVSQEKSGLLWVSLAPENELDYSVHVLAIFDSKYKEALLLLNKGEIVTVSGMIDSFSISPLLKQCSIVRSA